MGTSVCAACTEIWEGGALCPRCGGRPAEKREALLAWERARHRERIARWAADNVLDAKTAQALFERLDDEGAAVYGKRVEGAGEGGEGLAVAAGGAGAAAAGAAGGAATDTAVERGADALLSGTAAFAHEVAVRWGRLARAVEEGKAASPAAGHGSSAAAGGEDESGPPSSVEGGEGRAERPGAEAGRAVFARGAQGAVVGAGIEALAALDDEGDTRGPARPLGALEVFWFIGTVLVLAGSVMGVREAWQSLEGVFRPLVIAAAFFVYHALFVGLARLLARRSAVTGGVLTVIAAGLLPVVFAAAAVALGQRPALGLPFAGALFAASAVTLASAGRVAAGPGAGLALAFGLSPALALELLIGAGGAPPGRRVLVALVALAPAGFVATRLRRAVDKGALVALAAVAYGAVAVGALALYGGPGDRTFDLDDDPLAARAIVGWLALASTIGWWATSGPSFAARSSKVGAPARILALAGLVGAACVALFTPPDRSGSLGLAAHAPFAVLALATAVLAVEERARRGALHVAMPIALATALVAGRTFVPDRPPLWMSCCVAVAAIVLLFSGGPADRARRVARSAWGLVAGVLALVMTVGAEDALATRAGVSTVTRPIAPWAGGSVASPLAISALSAAMLALAAHGGARTRRPWLHYFAAAFAFVAALAAFAPPRPEPGIITAMFACAGLALAYGLAAFGYAASVSADDERRPFDDLSLLFAALGAWAGVCFAPAALAAALPAAPGSLVAASAASTASTSGALAAAPAFAPGAPFTLAAAPALALAAVLFVRAARDRSGFVVAQGAVALALAVHLAAGAPGAGRAALLDGAACFAFAVLAAFRAPRPEASPRFGRALFGLVPLPLGGTGRGLLDGFAVCSGALALLTCLRVASWIGGPRPEAERPLVVLGGALVIATALVAFGSKAFEIVRARGSVTTLALGGVAIGLVSVANRVGRPLAPAVIGQRLSIVVVLVWLVSRALVAWGPKLGRALGRPDEGPRYHAVPHAGVAALGLLLLVDAALVGTPTWTRALATTPPLLLVGGAAGALLLYRSFGREPLAHLGLLALLGAAALAAAQRSVVGPDLVPLDPPGGRWVPRATADAAARDWLDPSRFLGDPGAWFGLWARAWLGLASAALALALLLLATTRVPAVARALRAGLFARPEAEAPGLPRALGVAVFAAALPLAFGLASLPSLAGAGVFFAAGLLSALATAPRLRAAALALAAPVLVHALAQRGAVVPFWAGPALAALALAAVLLGRRVSARRGRDAAVLAKTQLVALAYAPVAFAYALATGGGTAAFSAADRVGALAAAASSGAFRPSPAPPITVATLAFAAAAAALAWRGGLVTILAALPPLLLAAAGASFAARLTGVGGPGAFALLVTREGAMLSAGLAVAAAAAHAAAFVASRAGREDASKGLAFGRDVALVASALAAAVFVARRVPGGMLVGQAGLGALALALVVSLHAAVWRGTARHVALSEALLVAVYAFATREFDLRPEVHATVGLFYGFSLVGVVVIARRRGAAHFAGATRWVVAALPPALAWLMADGAASRADAAFALGASALYGTMAWSERSRAFGSLASLAANLGLVALALAQGLDGLEVYLGPLGILVAALSQIFAPTLGGAARGALRVLGGALLYLPAGFKLTAQLGESADGTYSVIFGAACLFGVVVGVVLRVRAYLALGTIFLTLDVVANLVNAGLRDHRVGFVLLSASGLAILAVMIAVTLRRELVLALLRRLRARLQRWD
jgi:hypothetical protein